MKQDRRTFRLMFLAAFSLLFLAGCDKENMGNEPDGNTTSGGNIQFTIGIAPAGVDANAPGSRAATAADFTTTWEDGDQIGIFAVQHASGTPGMLSTTPAENHINNVKLTYNGGNWTTDADVTLYFPPGTDVLDFYAYHPYDADANNPTAITFNVKTDQSAVTAGKSNYNASDLMMAAAKDVTKGTTVALTFSHALALVEVQVPAGTMKGSGPDATLTVSLRGMKPAATLNLGAEPDSEVTLATTGNEATSITLCRVESNPLTATTYTYRALVPAQTAVEGATLFFFYQNNKLFSSSALATALSMTAGKAARYEQTLPFTIQTVKIPAGTFQMGSPANEPNRYSDETQHNVTLTKDFYMSKYAITFAQYDAFCDATSRTKPSDNDWGRGSRPVINVSWNDAKAFADWVGGSLPTEAQWEYACRGGLGNKPFGIGTGYVLNNTLANFNWNSSWSWDGVTATASITSTGTSPTRTEVVGFYPANGYGLYDMHGNVWEWCSDWYGTYSSTAISDPTGPAADTGLRVLRGGSWDIYARSCRSAFRYYNNPGNASKIIGFRVVFPL